MYNLEEQIISEDDQNSYPSNKVSQPLEYKQHYHEVQSELSDKIQPKLTTPEPQKPQLQVPKEEKFKLRLPSVENVSEQEEEKDHKNQRTQTRQGRHGRIMIQKKQKLDEEQKNKRKAIKIYELGEEDIQQKEEDLYETLNQGGQKPKEADIPIRVTSTKQQQHIEIEQNYSNSFLDVKNEKDEENIPEVEQIEEGPPSQTLINPILDPKPLRIQPVRKNKRVVDIGAVKTAHMKKGLFHEGNNQDNQQQFFQFQKIQSRDSLETGMPSSSTSRDEFSSRNMLESLSPQKRSKKLKPLSKMIDRKEEQIYKIKTYEKIQVLNQKRKKLKSLKNGKYAITQDDIEERLKFLYLPIPFDRCLETIITRHKSCSKMGYINYDISTLDEYYLLSAKKMPFHFGSQYNLSLSKEEFSEKSDFYVGKVQGNFVGSLWNIHISTPGDSSSSQLEATVCYSPEWNCCQVKSRRIEIYLKNKSFLYQELEGSEDKKNLRELYEKQKNKTFKKIHKFVNKQPTWIPERQIFALNFRGKVKYSSVKNMIMINPDDEAQQGLLLAKRDLNEFSFDLQYPFTPLVAMAVAMTSFDFKLASQ